jgi:hypothetical protein
MGCQASPVDTEGNPGRIKIPRYEYLRVSFLGDDYSLGRGTRTNQGYTDIMAHQQCWRTVVNAEPGTGFATAAPGMTPYSDPARLDEISTDDPQLIIVQASAADPADGRAAEQSSVVFRELKLKAPSARIVMIGPFDPPAVEDSITQSLRSELRSAAAQAGITFLDPLDEVNGPWIAEVEYADNGFVPNSSGHVGIARRLTADLASLGMPRIYACDAVN